MLKDYKNLIIFIAIIFIVICGTLFYFFEMKKIGEIKLPEVQPKTEEYSFKDIIYNFWGFVTAKEGDTVSVEGIIPEPGKSTANQPLQTIKFKITADTKIAKLEKADKELKQVFVESETIQIKDNLALKADEINTTKKEAIATDILILPSLPPPLMPQGTTTPASTTSQ